MRKTLLYIVAIIFLLGGMMGLVKTFVPQMDWLSFRSMITYEVREYPPYVRIYGGIMAVMEIGLAAIILLWKEKLFPICIITVGMNMLGCLIAVLIGDVFGMVSLIVRILPLYLLIAEYKNVGEIKNE